MEANCTVEEIKGTLQELSQRMFNSAITFNVAYTNEKTGPECDPKHPARLRQRLQRVVDRDCKTPHTLPEVIAVMLFAAQFLREAERSSARVQ